MNGSATPSHACDVRRWLAWLRPRLSEGRYRHCLGTCRAARTLVRRHGLEVEPRALALACLLHDCAKEMDEAAARRILGDEAPDGPLDLGLWHGIVGARVLEEELGVTDEAVLHAVAFHNTGGWPSSPLLELLVVADYGEPGRTFPESDRLDLGAWARFDDLLVEVQRRKLTWCLSKGKHLAPRSVEAWNAWTRRRDGR